MTTYKTYNIRDLVVRMRREPEILLPELEQIHSQLKIDRDLMVDKVQNLSTVIKLTHEIAARNRRTHTQCEMLEDHLTDISTGDRERCDLTELILMMPPLD